jgi:hypothetical protein
LLGQVTQHCDLAVDRHRIRGQVEYLQDPARAVGTAQQKVVVALAYERRQHGIDAVDLASHLGRLA